MAGGTRGAGASPLRSLVAGGLSLCALVSAGADLALLAVAADDTGRARVHLVVGAAAAVSGLALAGLALALRRLVFAPLEILAKETRIVAGVNPGYEIDVPGPHLLGEVPKAVHDLGVSVASSKREIAASVAERSRDLEQRRERLEAILTSLREGIVVCDEHARIVFYNPAARQVFHENPALGVGRSLSLLVASAPLENALQVLRRRRRRQPEGDDGREADFSFVCTAPQGTVLNCRIRLLPEMPGHSWSFLFACEDISGEADARGRRESLLRSTVKGMRAPLTALALGADSLELLPELDAPRRAALQRGLAEDARALVAQFDVLAREVEEMESPRYVIRDVFVEDLVAFVAQRVEAEGVRLTMIGDALWVKADVQALLFLLEFFTLQIARSCGVRALELESLLGDRRVYFNYCWHGAAVTQAQIQQWTSCPAEPHGAHTVAEMLERLGSEVWSQRHETPGFSTLRFPLPSSPGRWAAPTQSLPSRPVYADLPAFAEAEPVADRGRLPLAQAHFVVFDTETTGLAPLGGDEIVSIAGVRIINQGLIVGETFDRLVDPGRPIPASSVRFHGITDEKVRGLPRIEETLRAFHRFVGDAVLVGHNGAFDMRFIRLKEDAAGVHFRGPVLDTLALSRFLHDHTPAHSLDAVAQRVGVAARDRHTALGDALITAQILLKFLYLLRDRGVSTLGGAFEVSSR